MNSSGISNPINTPRHSRMAQAAVILSIVAFIIPLGVTALILAFFAKRSIARDSSLEGEGTAKAAIVVASAQLVMVFILVLLTWGIIRAAITQFRNDQMVQHVLRDYDDERMLDHDSAHDEEQVAEEMITELMALEEKSYRTNGRYVCSVLNSSDSEQDSTAHPFLRCDCFTRRSIASLTSTRLLDVREIQMR